MSGQQERLQPSNDGSNSTSDTGYVPPPLADFTLCRTPIKKVYDGSDIPNWLESEAFERVMTVMMRCNAAIRGKRRDDGERRRETTNPVSRQHALFGLCHLAHPALLASSDHLRPSLLSSTCSIISKGGLRRSPWTPGRNALVTRRLDCGGSDWKR